MDSATACPKKKQLSCYTYVKNSVNQKKTGCYEATCTEKPSDAPKDMTCDKSCMKDSTKTSTCLFPYNTCAPAKLIASCPKQKVENNTPKLPIKCYENPVQVPDSA